MMGIQNLLCVLFAALLFTLAPVQGQWWGCAPAPLPAGRQGAVPALPPEGLA
jgi:hypothetical protein